MPATAIRPLPTRPYTGQPWPGGAPVRRAVWWLVLIRGILAILFGLFTLVAPTVLTLVFVFGGYAVLDGVTAVAAGLSHRRDEAHWVWHVVLGVVSVLAGIVAFVLPGSTDLSIALSTTLSLVEVLVLWSVVTGIVGIVQALVARRVGRLVARHRGRRPASWGWMLAAGVLSVLFGIVLGAEQVSGLINLLLLVGGYAVVFGAILVCWALQLRRAVAAVR